MTAFDRLERLRQQRRLPAKLVFDTAARPAAAGIRKRSSTSRHLLYEIEDHCLDLRLDRSQQSGEATVVGQLADRQDPLKPLSGLRIFLVSEESFVAQTISNRQGEFRLQYTAETPVTLCLSPDDKSLIEVPVEPQAGEAANSER